MFKQNTRAIIVIPSIILTGCILRCLGFFNDIDGEYLFRQTHVASNIYYYVRDGIEIPGTLFVKNQLFRVFDFPLYQWVVAALTRLTHLNYVYLARGVNIILYILSSMMIVNIMKITGTSRRIIVLTLFLFAVSPLNVFYNRAIIPDNLSIFLAITSLYYFLKYDESHSYTDFVIMNVAGIVSAAIKSPVYLPFFISIVFYCISKYGWRVIVRRDLAFYSVLLVLSILIFKLYMNYINTGTFREAEWEHAWYFSTLGDRIEIRHHITIIGRCFTQIINPLWGMFLVYALIHRFMFRSQYTSPDIFIGLMGGTVITILIFFNLHWIHHYYLLPFAFIVCYYASLSIEKIYLKLISNVQTGPSKTIVGLVLTIIFISVTIAGYSLFGIRKLPATGEPQLFNLQPYNVEDDALYLSRQGELIRDYATENDFVFHIALEETNWDPQFLYFARREGYNLGINDFGIEKMGSVLRNQTRKYKQTYLYVIPSLYEKYSRMFDLPELQLLRDDEQGKIFLVTLQES